MAETRPTRVIRVREKADLPALDEAAQVLRNGGLVAFPTETVYGLGANALDEAAVMGIFRAKGRPADNPLIVHVAAPDEAEELVEAIPPEAQRLMERFWPGPLTLILPRLPHLPDAVTAGLDTVAVRMPAHPVALALIRAAGVPVAAPSANISGRPSSTRAEDVIADMEGRVDVIVDGGETPVGLESTVVDLSCRPPALLRPGGITAEMLQEDLPDLRWAGDYPPEENRVSRSPGMRYQHYAPRAELVVVEGTVSQVNAAIISLAREYEKQGLRVGIMATRETAGSYPSGLVRVVGRRQDLSSVAQRLFACLRAFDGDGVDVILAEGFDAPGLGLAIMNRLRKAAGYRVVQAGTAETSRFPEAPRSGNSPG